MASPNDDDNAAHPTNVCTLCATLWWSDGTMTPGDTPPGDDEVRDDRCPSADGALRRHTKRAVGAPTKRRAVRRTEALASKAKGRLAAAKERLSAAAGRLVDAII